MPKKEVPVGYLSRYLPAGAEPLVLYYLEQHRVHLTIARKRQTLLGDYRHPVPGRAHRISINGNLNPYAFLITLVHELAHLITFERFGPRVAAHGTEWKQCYGVLLTELLSQVPLPGELQTELRRSLKNPAASSCAEESLMRVLKKYDVPTPGTCLLEQLQLGETFRIADGRIFIKGERLRKRYKCTDAKTEAVYLFSPIYEVERWVSKEPTR
ncbi:MAG: SprT-like domain-containing protein [Sphingomonadales bacterium]